MTAFAVDATWVLAVFAILFVLGLRVALAGIVGGFFWIAFWLNAYLNSQTVTMLGGTVDFSLGVGGGFNDPDASFFLFWLVLIGVLSIVVSLGLALANRR